MRGRALQERRKEYVEAAANLGFPAWRIMLFHLLPNCMGPVLVVRHRAGRPRHRAGGHAVLPGRGRAHHRAPRWAC